MKKGVERLKEITSPNRDLLWDKLSVEEEDLWKSLIELCKKYGLSESDSEKFLLAQIPRIPGTYMVQLLAKHTKEFMYQLQIWKFRSVQIKHLEEDIRKLKFH